MTHDAELAKFHKLCGVSVIVEADGSNPVLCVSANVKDTTTGEYHEFKRCIALNPIMRMLADRIRMYHDKLHSQMNVSGRLPNPNLGWDNPDFENYQDWIDGEKHWRGLGHDYDRPREQGFYNAPEYVDDAGLPPGVDPLQVQGWFDKIKKVARHVGEAKAVKSLYGDLKTYGAKAKAYADKGAKWAAAHQKELTMAAALVPGGGPFAAAAVQTGFKVYDAVQAARQKNPAALAALAKIKTLAENGDLKAADAYKAAQLMNNMMKAKETGTKVSGDYYVSGWLYNRPYRTNIQVVADAVQGKFPTVGMAIRQGWHDGLEFVGTMKRKNYGPSLG